mmetsp:Transcript_10264/g.14341  ORF Transcript_10264/g.14341 Transcript_10264/m.14341 type:complete len:200 (-) Transcript_10264:950-1549(-)
MMHMHFLLLCVKLRSPIKRSLYLLASNCFMKVIVYNITFPFLWFTVSINDSCPISCVKVLLQFFIPPTNNADGRINAHLNKSCVHGINNVRQGSNSLSSTHNKYHRLIRVNTKLFFHISLIFLPLLSSSIAHFLRLNGKVVADRKSTHDKLIIRYTASFLRKLFNSIRRNKHLINTVVKPSTMSRTEISNYSKEWYVPS